MTTTPTRLELSLRAEPPAIRVAREAVARAASTLGVSRDVLDDIRLCVSEAVTNAVRHAYPGEPGDVQVTCDRFGAGALVVVRDFGLGTAPPRAPKAPEGGFGWRIIEALADRYSVRSSPEDGTEVWMSFGSSAGRTRARRVLERVRPRMRARSNASAETS